MKKLAYLAVKAGKSEICRAGWQARSLYYSPQAQCPLPQGNLSFILKSFRLVKWLPIQNGYEN